MGESTRCPECGGDPRSGRMATPAWARASGLPLLLAFVAAITLAYLGTRHERQVRVVASRSADECWVLPEFTVAQLRAAAGGDRILARAMAEHVLGLAAADAMVFRTARLRVSPFRGEGWHVRQLRFGWPMAWLTFSRTANYGDIVRREGAVESGAAGPTRLRWHAWQPGLELSRQRGVHYQSAGVNLGAAAAAGLLFAGLMLIVVRIVGRDRVGRTLGVAAVVAVVLLLLPRGRERMEANADADSGLSLDAVSEAAATDAGAVEFVSSLLALLPDVPDHTLVQFSWRPPLASHDTTLMGIPASIVAFGTKTPVEPAVGEPERHISVLEDCIILTAVDTGGTQRFISLSHTAAAALMAPALLVCISPHLVWSFCRPRRQRQFLREGKCLQCGYRGIASIG